MWEVGFFLTSNSFEIWNRIFYGGQFYICVVLKQDFELVVKFVELDLTIFYFDGFLLFTIRVKGLSLLLTKTHKTLESYPHLPVHILA